MTFVVCIKTSSYSKQAEGCTITVELPIYIYLYIPISGRVERYVDLSRHDSRLE